MSAVGLGENCFNGASETPAGLTLRTAACRCWNRNVHLWIETPTVQIGNQYGRRTILYRHKRDQRYGASLKTLFQVRQQAMASGSDHNDARTWAADARARWTT